MDKAEAVLTIVSEGRRITASNASAKRILRATKVLNLSAEETIHVFSYLDFCKADGTPYSSKIKRIW